MSCCNQSVVSVCRSAQHCDFHSLHPPLLFMNPTLLMETTPRRSTKYAVRGKVVLVQTLALGGSGTMRALCIFFIQIIYLTPLFCLVFAE